MRPIWLKALGNLRLALINADLCPILERKLNLFYVKEIVSIQNFCRKCVWFAAHPGSRQGDEYQACNLVPGIKKTLPLAVTGRDVHESDPIADSCVSSTDFWPDPAFPRLAACFAGSGILYIDLTYRTDCLIALSY